MKTPYGFDCLYFYADYFRGRSLEECRLLPPGKMQGRWSVNLCASCPVPGITRANACPNMTLIAETSSGFLGLGKTTMKISAYCTLSKSGVLEPHVGCGQCHPLPPEFKFDKS